MVLENFIISSVIFAHRAIIITLYVGEFSDGTMMSAGRSSSSHAYLETLQASPAF